MSRPSIDEYMMRLAQVAASRTTCIKRGVGCVLADAKGRVLSIGYNGVASGMPHCNEQKLEGADYRQLGSDPAVQTPSRMEVVYPYACKGHDLPPGQDSCESIHAEQNALLQCRDPREIATAYVTLSPCKPCVKLLMNTGCQRIVFLEEHVDPWPKEQWLKLGREWVLITLD